MNRFQLCLALLAGGSAVFWWSSLALGEPFSNDRIEAAAAALTGLAEAGSIPAPALLQVLRLPGGPAPGSPPRWGDEDLSAAVLTRLGGNARSARPSLAMCDEIREPTVGARCRFQDGTPVAVRVEALGAQRGVVYVVILDVTSDPGMPLELTGYRVTVSRATSGAWRFGGILSEEPARVSWRAFATIRVDSLVPGRPFCRAEPCEY